MRLMRWATELTLAQVDVGANAVPLQRVHETPALDVVLRESMRLQHTTLGPPIFVRRDRGDRRARRVQRHRFPERGDESRAVVEDVLLLPAIGERHAEPVRRLVAEGLRAYHFDLVPLGGVVDEGFVELRAAPPRIGGRSGIDDELLLLEVVLPGLAI